MQKDSVHNLFKGIREIARLRAKRFAENEKYNATHVPSRKRRLWLNPDGTVVTENGKLVRYNDIDWENFKPNFVGDKGVQFVHVNYYN